VRKSEHRVNDNKDMSGFDDEIYRPKVLEYMKPDMFFAYQYTARDFMNLINYLNSNSGNFFLMGDSSVLYGLTNRPSISPSLWFHRGLTIPVKGTIEFEQYEDQLIQNLEKYDVRYVIFEGAIDFESFLMRRTIINSNTMMGGSIRDFERLYRKIEKATCHMVRFGGFTVIEMCK
jgi:hypothetical protein